MQEEYYENDFVEEGQDELSINDFVIVPAKLYERIEEAAWKSNMATSDYAAMILSKAIEEQG